MGSYIYTGIIGIWQVGLIALKTGCSMIPVQSGGKIKMVEGIIMNMLHRSGSSGSS